MDDAPQDLTSARRPPSLWPYAVGLLVLQLLTFVGARPDSGTELALDVVAFAAGLASVPCLVRWPVHAAVVLGLMAALSPVATPAATGAVFVVAQRRTFRTAIAVAAVGVAGHLVLASWRPVESLPFVWWAVLVVVAYGLLIGWGAYVQARRALLCRFASGPGRRRPPRRSGWPRPAGSNDTGSRARCTTCSRTGSRWCRRTPAPWSTDPTPLPSASPRRRGWSGPACTRRSTSCAR